MKFYGIVAALCAVPATAFVAQPSKVQSSALFSSLGPGSLQPMGGGPPPGVSQTANKIASANKPGSGMAAANSDMLRANMAIPEEQELIQGSSLRTWPVNFETDKVHLQMTTEGRPLTANVELWHGPDYTPSKMKVYVEDGKVRPFNCVVATPKAQNTIAVYNTANLEFPFSATVRNERDSGLAANGPGDLLKNGIPRTVQGGAITSFPFDPRVESVQVLLKTDGRNCKCRIELMQGPNNDKQVIEFYSSDGKKRPIYAVIETPGSGNVVRIINENTVEFPFTAFVEPYVIGNGGGV